MGYVIERQKRFVWLLTEEGETREARCRRDLGEVVVGDQVFFEKAGTLKSPEWVVTSVAPREKVLAMDGRTVAANANRIYIIQAFREGVALMPWHELEKVALWSAASFPVSLLLHKMDLLTPTERQLWEKRALAFHKSGIEAYLTSQDELTPLLKTFSKRERSLFIGPSGAGKSTLATKLLQNPHIRIGEMGKSGYGKHTTTVPKAYLTGEGGWIIDMPGIRGVALAFVPLAALQRFFGYHNFTGGSCRFPNCMHLKEPNCVVRDAFENDPETHWRYPQYAFLAKDFDKERRRRKYGD